MMPRPRPRPRPDDRLRRTLVEAAAAAREAPGARAVGRVESVTGPVVTARLPGARVGDACRFAVPAALGGEVVGFVDGAARLLVLGHTRGIGPGTEVGLEGRPRVEVGPGLLGRVVDAGGRPLDGRRPPGGLRPAVLDRAPPPALERRPIEEPLPTGVRVLDGLLPLGLGQRIGVFAGPGVGKSTLLGALATGAPVDVVVVALVGERGREVRELLEGPLAPVRARSVVVVATGDAPALLRARAAVTATAVAEHFRDRGLRVLLLVDSLTRYARALREVGLAAGEAPARGGFPPSVFAALPPLLERAGNDGRGSITAVYTVLQEDETGTDALADEVRGLLDGHVVLSRRLADRGHWPAVDVPASVSRLAGALQPPPVARAAARVRAWISAFEERRELVVLGAWEPGSDPEGDEAVARWPEVEAFLLQGGEAAGFEETRAHLLALGGGA